MSFLSPPPPGVHPLHAHQLALGPGAVLPPPAFPFQPFQQRPAFPQAQQLTEAPCRQSISRQSRVQDSSNLHEADNIKVAVRVRPLLPAEKERGANSVINVADDHSTVEVVMPGPSGSKVQRDFQFHACLGPSTTQSEVFQLCGVQQLLDAALAGYNVTIFAYGMTGSGKTYTMSGREEVICQDGYQGDTKDGIVTQSVNYLYKQIKERQDATYSLSASYLEIYNEGVYDLLPAPAGLQGGRSTAHTPNLTARESSRQPSQQDSGKAGTGAAVSFSSSVGGGGGEGGSGKQQMGQSSVAGSGGSFSAKGGGGGEGGGKQQLGQTTKPGTSAGLAFKPGSMPSAPAKPGTAVPVSRDLSIKWDANLGFHVPGLRTVQCNSIKQMFEVIHSGMQHRHVGSHKLNTESSRSHSLMTIYCHATPNTADEWGQGGARCGKICFVDLAGSERLKDSKSEGTMLKETTNINKSLFVLGKVISALADRDNLGVGGSHIPYRDSKLTKLLMDSLGGSALALMIACCSPSSAHVEETLSTLSYATRAKNIQNRPLVQYDPEEAQAATYRREIGLLRQENGYLREQLLLGKTGLPPLAHHLSGTDPGSSASSVVGMPPYRFPGRPPLPSPSSSILSGYGPAPWANNSRNWGAEAAAQGATAFGGGVSFAGGIGGVVPSVGGGLSSTGSSRGGPRGILKAPSPCPPLRLPDDQGSPARLTPQGSSGAPLLSSSKLGALSGGALMSAPLPSPSGLAHLPYSNGGSDGAMLRSSREAAGATLPMARPGSGAAWHVPPQQDPLLSHGAGHHSSSDHLAGHVRVGSGGDGRGNHDGNQEGATLEMRKSCSHSQLQGLGTWSPTNSGSGRFSGSRPGSKGRAGQGPDDLMQRLRETQALLSRFSEEKSLLARENDRLSQGRPTPPEKDHADVLEEITALRERLMGLESAVKAGHTPPAAVKALLGSLRQERGSPCSSPSFSTHGPRTAMHARSSRHSSPTGSIAEFTPPANAATGNISGGFGVSNGGAEMLGKSSSFANGAFAQHQQQPPQPPTLSAAPSKSSASPPGSPQHQFDPPPPMPSQPPHSQPTPQPPQHNQPSLQPHQPQHRLSQQHLQQQPQLHTHPHSPSTQPPPSAPWPPPPNSTPPQSQPPPPHTHAPPPAPPTHATLHPPPHPPPLPLNPSQPPFVHPPHTLPHPLPYFGAPTPQPTTTPYPLAATSNPSLPYPAQGPTALSAPPHMYPPPTEINAPLSHPHMPILSTMPPLPTPQSPLANKTAPHTPMHPPSSSPSAAAAASQQQQPTSFSTPYQQPPLSAAPHTAPHPSSVPPTASTQHTPPQTATQHKQSPPPPPPPPPPAAAPKPGDKVVVADPAKLALLLS